MIRIIDSSEIEQGSDQWHEIRNEYVTGTDAYSLLRGKPIAEILKAKRNAQHFENYYTVRGHILESEAKKLYTLLYNEDVSEVGFVINDEFPFCGVSPDGLIGDDRVVEVKCFKPERQLKIFNSLTPQIIAQTQYEMFVTGRPKCQFMMYCPELDNEHAFMTKILHKNDVIQKRFMELLKN